MIEPYPPRVPRGTVAALAVVVATLVAVTGLFVALVLVEGGEIGRLKVELAGTERELESERTRLKSHQSAVDELDLERDGLERSVADLRSCAGPTKAAIAAGSTGDRASLATAVDLMVANCEE